MSEAEVTDDTELKATRDAMEAFIDSKLKSVGITVPLAATNTAISDICADLCAGQFRRNRALPDEENSHWKSGMEKLDAYREAEGEAEIPFIVGEDTS